MTHRDIAYNWRATMGNAEKLSPEVVAYLDLVTGLAQDDGHYPYRTANLHSCAIDDPMVILHHVQRSGLCCTPADHRLFDKALAEIKQHRRPFMDDAEMARRMQEADGACPMCGFHQVFHTGDYGDGYQPMMTHCQHNMGPRVSKDAIDAYLRRPSSWKGARWPYSGWDNQKLTRADGTAFDAESAERYNRCIGCQEMEAYSSMEQALFALVTSDNLDRFARPGCGSPVSGMGCQWKGTHICTETGGNCDHVYMRIKRAIADTRDSFHDSQELRLNGAGLKLYISRVRMPAFHGQPLTFKMRVGGDQVDSYPGFQAFAHELFNQFGVPTS